MNEVGIWYVIGDAGDGSNFVEWVNDQKVLDRMKILADNGDEIYASGDGLQSRILIFQNQEQLDWFIWRNRINFTTLEELDDELEE